MAGLLGGSLSRVLNDVAGKDALAGASPEDIASYDRHWCRVAGAGPEFAAGSIPTAAAARYLASELVGRDAIAAVLGHLGVGQNISRHEFQLAAHLLYIAVREAQDELFTSDDMWADAPPASTAKKRPQEKCLEGWRIGAMASVHERSFSTEQTASPDPLHASVLGPTSRRRSSPLKKAAPSQSCQDSAEGGALSIDAGVPATGLLRTGSVTSPAKGAAGRAAANQSGAAWRDFDAAFALLGLEAPKQQPELSPEHSSEIWEELAFREGTPEHIPPNLAAEVSGVEAFHDCREEVEEALDHSAAAAAETAQSPAAEWASFGGRQPPPVSLATAGALLATGLQPMSAEERQRCQTAYDSKGYAREGGMPRADAAELFARSHLDASLFPRVWAATGAGEAGALTQLQFCTFMHLTRCAVRGRPPPEGLTPGQAERLVEGGRGGFSTALPLVGAIRMDTARVKAALVPGSNEADDEEEEQGGSDLEEVAEKEVAEAGTAVVQHRLQQLNLKLQHCREPQGECAVDGSSLADDDDFSDVASTYSTASHASHASSSWHSGGVTARTAVIGFLTARTAAALPPVDPATARIERAVWEDQAGVGHSHLEVRLRSGYAPPGKLLDRPFVQLSVRDSQGRLLELPQDSHPGLYNRDSGAISFGDQPIQVATPLSQLPPGCAVFLEVRQWKARERRFSTVAWSFVRVDMLVDTGPLLSRVRCGPVAMPLYKKPMDVSLQRMKRVATKGPGLQVVVRGME